MTQLTKLHSEEVVVQAPMSFTGSGKRIWKLTRRLPDAGWKRVLGVTGVVLLIALVWTLVLSWYVLWGIFVIPYRLMRRHQRNSHRQALQHRETLALLTEIEHRQEHAEADQPNAGVGVTTTSNT